MFHRQDLLAGRYGYDLDAWRQGLRPTGRSSPQFSGELRTVGGSMNPYMYDTS